MPQTPRAVTSFTVAAPPARGEGVATGETRRTVLAGPGAISLDAQL